MNAISNNTTVPSATVTQTLAANSQDPAPVSDSLRTDLNELKTMLNRLNNEKDPDMRTKLEDEFRTVLYKYCSDAGQGQDQLNQDLQEANLVEVGGSPYLKPSSQLNTALDDQGNMAFIMKYVLPEIDAVLGK